MSRNLFYESPDISLTCVSEMDTKVEKILATLDPEDRKTMEKKLKAVSNAPGSCNVRELLSVSRKPPIFNPETMEIDRFIRSFEKYVHSLALPDHEMQNIFRSYLSEDMVARIDQVTDPEEEDMSWADFKTVVTETLITIKRERGMLARLSLKTAAQEAGETLTEFGDRISKLGWLAYPKSEDKILREERLKDALSNGASKDQVRIWLVQHAESLSYTELISGAVQLDVALRTSQQRNNNPEVSVFPAHTSFPRPPGPSQIPSSSYNYPSDPGNWTQGAEVRNPRFNDYYASNHQPHWIQPSYSRERQFQNGPDSYNPHPPAAFGNQPSHYENSNN